MQAFPIFQNDPFLQKEFSKLEEENVGKVTPPSLRQILGSAITREGRKVSVPIYHEPRGYVNVKGAKSARNRESMKFDFYNEDNGVRLLPNIS